MHESSWQEARQLVKLPAVCGTVEATQKIKTGDRIRVDGTGENQQKMKQEWEDSNPRPAVLETAALPD